MQAGCFRFGNLFLRVRQLVCSVVAAFTLGLVAPAFAGNNPAGIQFAGVPAIVDTNTAFWVELTALNADGSVDTNFAGTVTITATGLAGPLPVASAVTGAFIRGQFDDGIQITAAGYGVRLGCSECPGQSDAFTVIEPAFYASTQPVSDIAWVDATQTLLACVPTAGGQYSNSIVAIDPATGLATNAYPIGFDPSQIQLSPAGDYLYIALSNQTQLQRFDTTARVASPPFALGNTANGVRFAYDFCVPPGMTNSVVVAARDRDSLGSTSIEGYYRYDSGTVVALPAFTSSGAYLVTGMDTNFDIALSPPLAVGDASTGTILASAPNSSGTAYLYRDGEFFSDSGNAYASSNLSFLGDYPLMLPLGDKDVFDMDPAFRRVFYLAGYFNYGTASYALRVYDRDLFEPLFQLNLPLIPGGAPVRLLRCGTNFLAFVTSNDELWFIRPDATQPPRPPADLALAMSGSGAPPVAGQDYTFSLSLSNAGPGEASVALVTNTLPANTVVTATAPSSGTVTVTSSAVNWNVSGLPPGSNATLQVTARFNSGGWQTNSACALGFEADPVFTNNTASLALNVALPQQSYGVFPVNLSVEDLLYDPARDRLVLSVTNTLASDPGQGLVIFNPYTGQSESFTPIDFGPDRIVRSDDGQFLYASLPDAGVVRQFNLPTLATNYDIKLGPNVYGALYPNYAKDMAAVPQEPESVVVWSVRHAGPEAQEYGWGIALCQNGIEASNMTESGGSWAVVFDTNSGALFGYDNGSLNRCELDSNGVSFVETYPMLYTGGSGIACASGHLFNTGGQMLDYAPFQVDWVFPGAQSAAAVAPDPVTGRVFYLVASSNWQINAYDVPTRHLLGALTVSNVVGSPGRMIRWGADGLAFATTGSQLVIIRSPMVQTNMFSDLSVTLTSASASLAISNPATFTVTVTNQGTLAATNIVLSNSVSAGSMLAVSADLGTWETNQQTLLWSIPSLAPGSGTEASFTVATAQTGLVTAISSAATSTFDPALSNNTALTALLVGQTMGLDTSASLQLPANDLGWSSALGQILVTPNDAAPNWGGTLLAVDPGSLAVNCVGQLGSDGSRLAASRDGSLLYAATDFGASMVALPSLQITNRFLVNPLYPSDYAADIQVQPGSNFVAAIAIKTGSGSSSWVAAYTGGEQMTNEDSFFSPSLSLQFGEAPLPLYSCNGSTFERYNIDSNGIELIDATSGLLPSQNTLNPVHYTLVWGNGLLYSSGGQVINPFTASEFGVISGIPANSLPVFDTNSGWVFYLSPGASNATLTAFDGATLLPAGARTIPGVNGVPSRFIRWGVDGFAAATTAGQVVLFRSSLLPTNPPADVSVGVALSAPPYLSGAAVTATILISNAGPNTATSVSWSNSLPAGAVVLSANSSAGTLATNGNSVTGNIPALAPGAQATATVAFTAPTPGLAADQATATASSVDPNFANNSAIVPLWVIATNSSSNLFGVGLQVKDLEADKIRPVLYASIGSAAGPIANGIVVIDPINQNISAPIFVGSNPGLLAASADGQFLYVALDGEGKVAKLSLPSFATVSSFAVPQNSTIAHLAVCPTNSDMVAIRRSPQGKTDLFIAGVQCTNELSSQDLFAFLDTTGALYGCDSYHSGVQLYQLDTSTNGGLALLGGQPGKQANSTNLVTSGGRLFYNRGLVVDPLTTRSIDLMPVPNSGVVAADAGCGRAFYFNSTSYPWSVAAFDIAQGVQVGAVPVPGIISAPQKLVRWGSNGLALFNESGQVFILQGELVPIGPAVDVSLRQSFSQRTATTNETLSVSLQVTNAGPVAAAGVAVTQIFSLPLTNVQVAPSLGAASYSNSILSWQVGNLPTNELATLVVTGQSQRSGTLSVTASAYHDLNDVFWGNNVAIGAVNILSTNASNVLTLSVPVREIVYDPWRDLLYASTPASDQLAGNLIAEFDPATGTLISGLAAGSEPDQFCLSDDGTYLHVGLDGAMGVQRFDLQSNIADLSFSFSTNDIDYAQDIISQPGHPATVAASLASYNDAAGFPSIVVAYDSGIRRGGSGGPARGLDFSSDGAVAFGELAGGSIGSLIERMTLGSNGFTTMREGGFTSVPGYLKFANGRLYSQTGQVIDATAGVLLGSFGVSGPQAIDGSGGRAFYLVENGTTWQIDAFDLASMLPTGTQVVMNVTGTPTGLIRCGENRLAFLTSGDQLFIVQSPLVVTNPVPPADLSVFQTVAQDFSVAGSPLQFTITVSNAGPGTASNVLMSIAPPTPSASLSLLLSEGLSTNSGPNYLCNLGYLPAGSAITAVLNAVTTNTACYSNFVSVTASTPDPNLANNTALAIMQGQFFEKPNSTHVYGPIATALAYDPMRQRLFASILPAGVSNALAWFDPQSGTQLGTMAIGLTPTKMLVTDDSQYLYLSATSTGTVQRVNLSSLTLDENITPPQADGISAMAIIPGSPHSIALCFRTNNISTYTTVVYDDSLPRTNTVTDHPFGILAGSDDGTNLYGYVNIGTGMPRVYHMAVTSGGLIEMDHAANDTPWYSTTVMKYALQQLFFGTGDVIAPASWTLETPFTLPDGASGGDVDVLAASGLAACLAGDNAGNSHFGIYSISNRAELQQIDINNIAPGPDLTWCGADRFAFVSGSGIVFLRASAVPAADISTTVSFLTNQLVAGETASIQIVVSNAGPYAVTNVFLTNTLPNGFQYVGNSASNLAVLTNGPTIVFGLGALNTNASQVLTVSASLSNSLVASITNSITVQDSASAGDANLPDPIPFNNSVSVSLTVVPQDSDLEELKISEATLIGPSNLVFALQGGAGITCTLQMSLDLLHWFNVSNFVDPSTNGQVSVPFSPSNAPTFYRIVVTSPP